MATADKVARCWGVGLGFGFRLGTTVGVGVDAEVGFGGLGTGGLGSGLDASVGVGEALGCAALRGLAKVGERSREREAKYMADATPPRVGDAAGDTYPPASSDMTRPPDPLA